MKYKDKKITGKEASMFQKDFVKVNELDKRERLRNAIIEFNDTSWVDWKDIKGGLCKIVQGQVGQEQGK